MPADIVCFSHLRWDFVYQRPNHLMAHAARSRRVFYVEEPVEDSAEASLSTTRRDGVVVMVPRVPTRLSSRQREEVIRPLVGRALADEDVARPVVWMYSPMALPLTADIPRSLLVYDCMDFLAGFLGAPAGLRLLEDRLLRDADVVFTGGVSLQRRIAQRRPDAECLPSSVDQVHFRRSRTAALARDVVDRPRPRFGYAGVIDERLDLDLVRALADAYPQGTVMLVGPTAKIDPGTIPAGPNIVAVGGRPYGDLPSYLGGWDVGIMPFAHNEATRYISPTKTPEYLAAGLPVASTSIRDVVQPYGQAGLVEIGDGPDGFVAAAGRALATDPSRHRARADAFLRSDSWEATWAAMDDRLEAVAARRQRVDAPSSRLRSTRVDALPTASRRHAIEEDTAVAGAGAD
ncbi:MAG: glycosyltransferase family 1 protein [Chloroflexota bacterium]